jgi:hypothetical protein
MLTHNHPFNYAFRRQSVEITHQNPDQTERKGESDEQNDCIPNSQDEIMFSSSEDSLFSDSDVYSVDSAGNTIRRSARLLTIQKLNKTKKRTKQNDPKATSNSLTAPTDISTSQTQLMIPFTHTLIPLPTNECVNKYGSYKIKRSMLDQNEWNMVERLLFLRWKLPAILSLFKSRHHSLTPNLPFFLTHSHLYNYRRTVVRKYGQPRGDVLIYARDDPFFEKILDKEADILTQKQLQMDQERGQRAKVQNERHINEQSASNVGETLTPMEKLRGSIDAALYAQQNEVQQKRGGRMNAKLLQKSKLLQNNDNNTQTDAQNYHLYESTPVGPFNPYDGRNSPPKRLPPSVASGWGNQRAHSNRFKNPTNRQSMRQKNKGAPDHHQEHYFDEMYLDGDEYNLYQSRAEPKTKVIIPSDSLLSATKPIVLTSGRTSGQRPRSKKGQKTHQISKSGPNLGVSLDDDKTGADDINSHENMINYGGAEQGFEQEYGHDNAQLFGTSNSEQTTGKVDQNVLLQFHPNGSNINHSRDPKPFTATTTTGEDVANIAQNLNTDESTNLLSHQDLDRLLLSKNKKDNNKSKSKRNRDLKTPFPHYHSKFSTIPLNGANSVATGFTDHRYDGYLHSQRPHYSNYNTFQQVFVEANSNIEADASIEANSKTEANLKKNQKNIDFPKNALLNDFQLTSLSQINSADDLGSIKYNNGPQPLTQLEAQKDKREKDYLARAHKAPQQDPMPNRDRIRKMSPFAPISQGPSKFTSGHYNVGDNSKNDFNNLRNDLFRSKSPPQFGHPQLHTYNYRSQGHRGVKQADNMLESEEHEKNYHDFLQRQFRQERHNREKIRERGEKERGEKGGKEERGEKEGEKSREQPHSRMLSDQHYPPTHPNLPQYNQIVPINSQSLAPQPLSVLPGPKSSLFDTFQAEHDILHFEKNKQLDQDQDSQGFLNHTNQFQFEDTPWVLQTPQRKEKGNVMTTPPNKRQHLDMVNSVMISDKADDKNSGNFMSQLNMNLYPTNPHLTRMMHHPGSNDYYSYSPNGDNKTLQTQQTIYQEKGKEVSNVNSNLNSNVIQKKNIFPSDNISFQNTQHSQREIKTNVAFPRVNRQTTFLPPNRSFPSANRPEQPRK